jgi:hypothetical protein
VSALRDSLADALDPAGAFEMRAPHADDGVAGEQLQEDRQCDQGKSERRTESNAGGDMEDAHGKSQQG